MGLHWAQVLRLETVGADGGRAVPPSAPAEHFRIPATPRRRYLEHEEGRRRGDAQGDDEQKRRLTLAVRLRPWPNDASKASAWMRRGGREWPLSSRATWPHSPTPRFTSSCACL